MTARVTETFFSISVRDMARATAFYEEAFGATVQAAVPFWSSLHIAGVRVGLALIKEHAATQIGLHFAVSDLDEACASVERAGGRVVTRRMEVAPGVVIATVTDTEGNSFTLRA